MANKKLIRRVERNPALLKRMLANPGQRARLPDRLLPKKLRQQRQLNARLRQPVTPGSSLTERDLARESKAAMDVKYGPVQTAQRQELGESQNYQRDIAGYYDDYLRSVARQAANVRVLGDQANAAVHGLQAGVTGLAGADLSSLQGQANQDAATRGATAGDLSGMANQAAAVRQALVGTLGDRQVAQTNAASRYADMIANNVAPGQKLQAVAGAAGRVRQVRERQSATARERGAADLSYRGERRADEAKQALAQSIAGDKSSDAAFDRRMDRRKQSEVERGNRADEKWRKSQLNAKGQEVNKYGVTESEWRKMSTAERQRTIRKFGGRGSGSSGSGGGGGGNLRTAEQRGSAMTNLNQIRSLVAKARAGQPFVAGHKAQPKLDRHAAAKKILEFGGKDIKDPVLVSAALDAAYDGHLSTETMKRLRAAGFSRRQVAQTLGTMTRGDYDRRGRARTRANTKAYRGQSNLGGSGHM